MASKPEKAEYKGYAERLFEIRQSRNLNQKDIAKMINCSLASWQEYETAKSAPNAKVLEALVEMGFSANWILSGIGEMKITDTPVTSVSASSLNYKALKFIVKTIETEIQNNEANLSPSGFAQVIAVAYDAFITSDCDFNILNDKIKTQIQIFDLGEE